MMMSKPTDSHVRDFPYHDKDPEKGVVVETSGGDVPCADKDLEKGIGVETSMESKNDSMPQMGKVNSTISAALLVPNERVWSFSSDLQSYPILPTGIAVPNSARSEESEDSEKQVVPDDGTSTSSKDIGFSAMEGILPVVPGGKAHNLPNHSLTEDYHRPSRRPSESSVASSKAVSQVGSTTRSSKVILNHGSDELSESESIEQISQILEQERSRLRAGVHSKAYTNDTKLTGAERQLRKQATTDMGKDPSASSLGLGSRARTLTSLTDGDEPEEEKEEAKASISPIKWMITILTAVVVALQCGGMILASHKLTKLVLSAAALASGEPGNAGPGAGFCVMLGYALLVGFPSAMLVTYVAPNAGGSGIPDLKAHLNGNAMPKAFGFGAYFSRSVGLVLVTSAGLFAGTEGPFAHIGGIVGAGLSQGPPGRLRQVLRWPSKLLGHQARCEFIAQGAAIGVAAAFGAPVGGVLFTVEEATTFWSKDLTWRSFVGAMVACVCAKLVKNEFKGLGVGGFIDFPDVEASFAAWELIPFLIVGIVTGLLGALFCAIAKGIGGLRRKVFHLGSPQKHHKIARVFEVLVVSTVTLTVIFWVPMVMGCRDLQLGRSLGDVVEKSPSPSFVGEMPETICPEGQYSDVAAILLAPKETAIKALFTRHFMHGAYFDISGLLAAGFITYVLTLCTFGSAIPAGLFIPNILFGACIGRAVGEHLANILPHLDVHPGVYALMGAAGMLAGFSRMTVSLTMILLEITCNMRLLMPLMLVNVVAKMIGDRFTISVYDVILELNPAIHMIEPLDDDRASMLEKLNVHDVCTTNVVALSASEPLSAIVRILLLTQYAGYPVVDDNNRVLGIVQRAQLSHILCTHQISADDPYSPKSPGKNALINLIEFADTAPETVHWSAAVARGFRLFSATGIQHLCVVDESHSLLGILTRTDFAALTAHGSHGRKEAERVINRKLAAEASKSMHLAMPSCPGSVDQVLNTLLNLPDQKKAASSSKYWQGTGYSTPTAQTSYGVSPSPRPSETPKASSRTPSSRGSSRHSTPRGILPGTLNGEFSMASESQKSKPSSTQHPVIKCGS
jgi:chloride channel 7